MPNNATTPTRVKRTPTVVTKLATDTLLVVERKPRVPRHPDKAKQAAGHAIMKARLDRGLDRRGLAGIVGVTPVAVAQWERGEVMPHVTHLQMMKDYFCLSLDELTGSPPPKYRSFPLAKTAARLAHG